MTPTDELFNQYAGNYDAVLGSALSATGEDVSFYAQNRVAFLAGLLRRMNETPVSALDFGCGVGTATDYLLQCFDLKRLAGVDVSEDSIQSASLQFANDRVSFFEIRNYLPDASFDLVYCNGVFHHIPVAQRAESLRYIYESLRPGGIFALWENNPWNPGTRYVMDRCEFDRDANTLSPPAAKRMVRQAGFESIRTDFLFIFPRALRGLRSIEALLTRWPIGGQYQLLLRKPS